MAFVVIGRMRHGHALSVAGTWRTAWPFLAGMAMGWLIAVRSARGPLASGLVVWPTTVVIGLVLRALSHQGVDALFTFVAAAFLGLFLLGWRVILAARR